VLYHYQMMPFKLPVVAVSVEMLRVKMDALDKAILPDRFKAVSDAFLAQRARLSKAVSDLAELIKSGNEYKIREGIELVHADYDHLEKVFEAPMR
jgi:hypothetical protein